MLVTFLKPEGNFLKKVINIPDRLTTFINETFNQKIVNIFQDKTKITNDKKTFNINFNFMHLDIL